MKRTLCAQRGCFKQGRCGLGWGMHGLTQWWCPDHLPAALVRLDELLRAARRRAA